MTVQHPAVHRQITRCTEPATRVSTQNRLWELWVCDKHRHIAPRLAGSAYLNYRRLRPAEDPPKQCGTLHDRQPIDQALQSHARIWLDAPQPGEDGWVQQLRAAADHAAYVHSDTADDLAAIVTVAESGPSDPAVQGRVLALLAKVEASHVML